MNDKKSVSKHPQLNLNNAVESTSALCSDCSRDVDDVLLHLTGGTPSAKKNQLLLNNQHMKPSCEDSTAFFRLKSSLGFFVAEVTSVNSLRMQINRSKGLAKYLAKNKKQTTNMAPLDNTMGIMSFTLYAARFCANMGLLVESYLACPSGGGSEPLRKELVYSLLNDSLWGLVNLSQFFWLSFNHSHAAGLLGMRLESIVRLFDVIVLLIRFQHEMNDHQLHYEQANEQERIHLDLMWNTKRWQYLRALLLELAMALTFGLFSTGLAFSLSPVIFSLVIMSSTIRLIMDINSDRQEIEYLKQQETNPEVIKKEQSRRTSARMRDVNRLILTDLFYPLSVFLVLTTPFPVAIAVSLSLLLINQLIDRVIDLDFGHLSSQRELVNQ